MSLAKTLVLSSVLGLSIACLRPGPRGESGPPPAGSASVPRPVATLGPAVGLPIPPGPADVPRPSGAPDHLRVLDWAGFKSALTYTVDDGQPSQVEHYPELQATGVRMTFFLGSSATWIPGFASTFSQAVKDGHEIGNHTAHHCHAEADGTLRDCAGPSAAAELDDCTAFLTSKLGATAIWTTAAPYGDAGYRTAAAERFFLNRGVMNGTIAPNDDTDPFDLPIWGPVENDSAAQFKAVIDRTHRAGRWVIVLLHSIAPTSARWYATVDISAIRESIAHARSLGDVWIDTMANIGAYWRGAKLVSSTTPMVTGNKRTWTWTLPPHFPPGKLLRVKMDGGTLSQAGRVLTWDARGYYEIALEVGSLTLEP
jgi:peptidoglycan/xylan/chitin deacetylase (PgdA/CDA1 family)